MTQLVNWLAPETLRLLAQALLHFLWQGAALAALAYVVMSLCRSASTRYAIAVGTLVLMFAAPIGTFLVLRGQIESSEAIAAADTSDASAVAAHASIFTHTRHSPARPENAPYFVWLVEAWFVGVLLLSLRSAGGFLVVEHLRRKESTPVSKELLELCLSLQRRMGLERVVRYCESVRLDAPAVAGWIRPVVLLPITAITGLTEEQLEAVIAHELAHIQRHDAFVHLFQVGVETLLFYHPAVWWVGKRIRAERENCCDDVAVAFCGNAFTYADALTRMAEWKVAPLLVMAANSSLLVERIARVLGARRPVESFRGANLSAGVLCLATALLAASAFVGNVRHAHAQTTAATPETTESAARPTQTGTASRIPDTAFVIRPSDADEETAPKPRPTLWVSGEIRAACSSVHSAKVAARPNTPHAIR